MFTIILFIRVIAFDFQTAGPSFQHCFEKNYVCLKISVYITLTSAIPFMSINGLKCIPNDLEKGNNNRSVHLRFNF